ncbi:MAG TPA: class I SAM-dependent methyltransferase [Streptosporangiaceae bacterium]
MGGHQPGSGTLAAAFTYPGVADAYQHRPPYPPAVFDILTGLITDQPRRVLDLGAGEGALARPLAPLVDHVDALDISPAMVAVGQQRPGGGHPSLRWLVGAAETADLAGPYALVTAGASLHWMSWPQTLSRARQVMTGNAVLAVVEHDHAGPPWRAGLAEIIVRHSRSRSFDPGFSLVGALSASGLFTLAGEKTTSPAPFRQPVGPYIEQFHSRSSLAREWMTAGEAAEFDRAVADLVRPYARDGVLDLPVVAHVAWGTL